MVGYTLIVGIVESTNHVRKGCSLFFQFTAQNVVALLTNQSVPGKIYGPMDLLGFTTGFLP